MAEIVINEELAHTRTDQQYHTREEQSHAELTPKDSSRHRLFHSQRSPCHRPSAWHLCKYQQTWPHRWHLQCSHPVSLQL